MKHIYFILTLLSLFFVGTSCEDDYRDMVLFTGDRPINQIGILNNYVVSADLYLTRPDGITLGVDGGDGDYSIMNEDNSIATAAFVESENGYRRLQITPKSVGEVVITVKDGNGSSVPLVVTVNEYMSTVLYKVKEGIVVIGEATEEQKLEVTNAFADAFTVKLGGSYELIQDDDFGDTGVLLVRLDDTATAPIVGQYERVSILEGERRHPGLLFTYNEEEHLFYQTNSPGLTKSSVMDSLDYWEDVTGTCPVEVPEGCKVYHIERWSFQNQVRD
ncbi:hypothetical protein [Bacteroides sp. UBA939]|uniref:hypothetical protein n=1 Tax=Bacteroides sp. UBA939 TaxID=1946092 RepID=UPI0025C66D36|nr:hypothetical protein [Bacteroides sp. UBA939]